MDDLWNRVKGGAVLAQDVLPITRLRELHMHEAMTAPEKTVEKEYNVHW